MSDDAAFAAFVAGEHRRLLRSAYVLCGDRQHAEDLVQTVYVRMFRSWRRVTAAENVSAYASRTLVNVYLSWRARRWHGEQPAEQVGEVGAVLAGDLADEVSLRSALLQALARLSPAQRAVLVLRLWRTRASSRPRRSWAVPSAP